MSESTLTTTDSTTGEAASSESEVVNATETDVQTPIPKPSDIAPKTEIKSEQTEQSNESEDSPWNDPAKARAEIERLRRERGDERIQAKKNAADEARKELLATLTQALDPEAASKGEQLTLEDATAKLTEASTEIVNVRRDAAVIAEAWKLGVDPARVDFLQFQLAKNNDFQSLDIESADFAGKLSSVISQEIAKDSTLKLSGAARASGVDQHGGTAGASTVTKAEFAAMPYAKRLELYNTNRAEYDRLNAER